MDCGMDVERGFLIGTSFSKMELGRRGSLSGPSARHLAEIGRVPLPDGQESIRGYDEVVDHRDPDSLAHFHKSAGGDQIRFAWLQVSARMIVGHKDGDRVVEDGASIDFARMNLGLIHQTLGDLAGLDDLVVSIQIDDCHDFLRGKPDG